MKVPMKFILFMSLILWMGTANSGCAIKIKPPDLPPYMGDAFESICIKGRISEDQAKAINKKDWLHTPTYCEDQAGENKVGGTYTGQSDCQARKYDRILSAECSQAKRIAEQGD
jgi:hypothetical protein